MAHAIWTGSISFGLVTIPVKLLPAIRATPVGKVLTVEYQRVGDHPQKLTRMETELQDICRQNGILAHTGISGGILWAASTPFKD